MPVTKRSSKIVSYNEQQDDDDDDFISIKKVRTTKAVLKHDEKSEQEKPKKASESITIEIDDKESISSQSTISNSDVDDQISPKTKRIKHNEEESEPIIHQDIPITTSENRSIRLSDIPKRNSSLPLGFPTSKINIPSPHVSRVGLSRKSLPIKPLHPNLASRVVPE